MFEITVRQQNYLTKTDLDVTILFRENPAFMSFLVVVIASGITTTWTDIKTGFSQKNMELSKSVLVR